MALLVVRGLLDPANSFHMTLQQVLETWCRCCGLSLCNRFQSWCSSHDGGIHDDFRPRTARIHCFSRRHDHAYRRAAVSADRIFKREKQADLPVQQESKFELVINLRTAAEFCLGTAAEFGLEVPTTLLMRADELIDRP